MIDYLMKAGVAWFMGFFPLIEIYAAVPAAMALGLDYVSAAAWAIFGNYCPVLLIVFGYDRLMRVERINRWLSRRVSTRFQSSVERYGGWFILFATPWVGVWIVSTTARVLGMRNSLLLLYSFMSVALYGTIIALSVDKGMAWLAS